MLIQKPNCTSRLLPFSSATIDHLGGAGQSSVHLAGVSADGSFGWIAKGIALEVFSMRTNERLASWHFGRTGPESSGMITAITEFSQQSSMQLIVGTSLGLLCLFDVSLSTVVKVVRLSHGSLSLSVSAAETVSTTVPEKADLLVLSPQIKFFHGIVAIGTVGGSIFLLDMCLDDDRPSSEGRPSGIELLSHTVSVTQTDRRQAYSSHSHVCLELGRTFCADDDDKRFHYQKPSGDISYSCDRDSVRVTCMKFVRYTGLLAVGFSFGCFQLWKLNVPILEFSSRYDDGLMPVVKFVYQVPENDPKNYSYMWVVRGPTPFDPIDLCTSYITLYQLGFQNKTWHSSFGYLMEQLIGVWVRFEHDLHSSPFVAVDETGAGSRVLACCTLNNWRYQVPAALPENGDQSLDDSFAPDLSLCMFAWEAVSVSTDASAQRSCFLAIFDMNQFYNAQIPSAIRNSVSPFETSSFWAVYSLDDLVSVSHPEPLLTVHINCDSLVRFMSSSSSMLSSDQIIKYLQPSALGFRLTGLTKFGLVNAQCLGVQRQALTDIQSHGSTLLLDVNSVYAACVSFGLISSQTSTTVNEKREALLQMALEYGLVGFITSCIEQWSSVEFTSAGCTMRFILDWAWNVVTQLKESIDSLCEPLYDWSGQQLMTEDRETLAQHQITLSNLVTIFKAFRDKSSAATDQGKQELQDRLIVVQTIAEYLGVVLKFCDLGFLPELSVDTDHQCEGCAFPYEQLSTKYRQLRQNSEVVNKELVIEKLIRLEAPDVGDLFMDKSSGFFYPPSSFHMLLSMFLLPDININVKKLITLYVINDLIDSAKGCETNKFEERRANFCKSYDIKLTTSKYVRALWMLDHGHFLDALSALLDPTLGEEIVQWQHDAIIASFLNHQQKQLALRFVMLRNLPAVTPSNIRLRLEVLLANELTNDALEYLRSCRDRATCQELMSLLIQASLQTNSMKQLVQLSLSPEEEQCLVKYLTKCGDPTSQDLIILYYLQRSKIADAVQCSSQLPLKTGLQSEREKVIQMLVDGYKKTLPTVVQKIVGHQSDSCYSSRTIHHEYCRPTPLSATLYSVSKTSAPVVSRSRLLLTILDKVNQLKPVTDASSSQHTSQSDKQSTLESDKATAADVLFGTPVVPPFSARRLSHATRCEVVYPNMVKEDRKAANASCVSNSVWLSNTLMHSPSRSHTILSVLQTPPVVRKTPSQLSAVKAYQSPVPHSILSVRHKGITSSVKKSVKSSTRLTWHAETVFSPDFSKKQDIHEQTNSFAAVNENDEIDNGHGLTTFEANESVKCNLQFVDTAVADSSTVDSSNESNVAVPEEEDEVQLEPSFVDATAAEGMEEEVMETDEEITFNLNQPRAVINQPVEWQDAACREIQSTTSAHISEERERSLQPQVSDVVAGVDTVDVVITTVSDVSVVSASFSMADVVSEQVELPTCEDVEVPSVKLVASSDSCTTDARVLSFHDKTCDDDVNVTCANSNQLTNDENESNIEVQIGAADDLVRPSLWTQPVTVMAPEVDVNTSVAAAAAERLVNEMQNVDRSEVDKEDRVNASSMWNRPVIDDISVSRAEEVQMELDDDAVTVRSNTDDAESRMAVSLMSSEHITLNVEQTSSVDVLCSTNAAVALGQSQPTAPAVAEPATAADVEPVAVSSNQFDSSLSQHAVVSNIEGSPKRVSKIKEQVTPSRRSSRLLVKEELVEANVDSRTRRASMSSVQAEIGQAKSQLSDEKTKSKSPARKTRSRESIAPALPTQGTEVLVTVTTNDRRLHPIEPAGEHVVAARSPGRRSKAREGIAESQIGSVKAQLLAGPASIELPSTRLSVENSNDMKLSPTPRHSPRLVAKLVSETDEKIMAVSGSTGVSSPVKSLPDASVVSATKSPARRRISSRTHEVSATAAAAENLLKTPPKTSSEEEKNLTLSSKLTPRRSLRLAGVPPESEPEEAAGAVASQKRIRRRSEMSLMDSSVLSRIAGDTSLLPDVTEAVRSEKLRSLRKRRASESLNVTHDSGIMNERNNNNNAVCAEPVIDINEPTCTFTRSVISQSVDDRPLTPMSDTHSDAGCPEPPPFVFSMPTDASPRKSSVTSNGVDGVLAHADPATVTNPFVFSPAISNTKSDPIPSIVSPPASHTRSKLTTERTDRTSSKLSQPTEQAAVKKSKRVRKVTSEPVLLTPDSSVTPLTPKSKKTKPAKATKKNLRSDNARGLRW